MDLTTVSGLTGSLAAKSSSLRFDELPDDVVELARHALTDWFGVTLGGSREPGPLTLMDALEPRDPDDPTAVSIVGHPTRFAPRDAAMVNGTASHVLDFDDVNLRLPGHASVAVVAALLALGERHDVSGEELLTAFVAGYETTCRIATALGPRPYLLGFHATGTIGSFGAAAACCRLLGLDAETTTRALGIAASTAAGLKINFGTMTKALHAGRACESGLLACQLASHGFTANPTAIEGDQGFASISGAECDADSALAEPPAGWYLRENLFKHHAACYFTHSAIEGVRDLCARGASIVSGVRRIKLHVSEVEMGACAIPAPETGLEVKFSISHLVAMAMLGRDTVTISDASAADADAIALRERVSLVEDGVAGAPTRVEIEMADGTTLEAAHDVNTPEGDLGVQRERIERKFSALAAPVLGEKGAEHLLGLLGRVERVVGVRELMAAAAADRVWLTRST